MPTPMRMHLEPVATGVAIRVDSWLLDGEWLAYWLSTDLPEFFYPFPPGMLHLLNVRTSEVCSYAEYVARDHIDTGG